MGGSVDPLLAQATDGLTNLVRLAPTELERLDAEDHGGNSIVTFRDREQRKKTDERARLVTGKPGERGRTGRFDVTPADLDHESAALGDLDGRCRGEQAQDEKDTNNGDQKQDQASGFARSAHLAVGLLGSSG